MSTPPTLLLADDSLTIQRVVSLTFADQPVRLVVAKDGQDAINRMATDRPDLVLADTNMPCVDGYELARWVRQQPHLSAVPVLLLAGATDPVDEQRLYDSGANGVLEKPFEPSHVISRVKELLGIKSAPPPSATRLLTPVPEARAATTPPAPQPPPAPTSSRKSSGSRPAAGMFGDRADTGPAMPPLEARPADGGGAPAGSRPGSSPRIEVARPLEPGEPGGTPGDPREWFGAVDAPMSPGTAVLAEQLGVSGVTFYGQGEDLPSAHDPDADAPVDADVSPTPRPGEATASAPADVFASLLAAETGDARGPVVVRTAAAELTPEMLDHLAARVVERLRPATLREDLQRGVSASLHEVVTVTVRDSVAAETRAAVAEAVQASVNGTILGTIRGAVNEAVGEAVQRALREALEPAVREAVRDVLRESAERLISEEIAKIRRR